MSLPEELKYISPFIQRSQELAQRDPTIAYYAQYYAIQLAITKGPKTEQTTAYLSHLLDSLEHLKSTLGDFKEAITDDLVGYAHVENFALKVFLNADNEDREGKASKKTAKTFVAASVFLEILKTFGELDPEIEAKIKYAKWKAADILKALREGRTPMAGPPGGIEQKDIELDSTAVDSTPAPKDTVTSENAPPSLPTVVRHTTPTISEFPSPPSNFTAPLPSTPTDKDDSMLFDTPPTPPTVPTIMPHVPANTGTNHSIPAPDIAPQPTSLVAGYPPQPTSSPQFISDTSIADAQKNAKWAISALNYDDIPTARLQLLSALNHIGYNQSNNFGF
ncbi:Vta1 like-domain-containing protein [Spinellus fusiger]|nr:Vta1 like-domain-containing protein [Spinellus fusiger]